MSRQRSNCIIDKEAFLLDINKIESQLERANSKKTLTKQNDFTFSLNYKKPAYKAYKKEFPSKTKTPLWIKEDSSIKEIIDKTQIKKIETAEQSLDFSKFLSQFKNEEELNCIKIGEIVNTDFEEINELKIKTKKFIESCSLLLDEKLLKLKEQGKDSDDVLEREVLEFFQEKYNELTTNETNLHILIDNFEKVKEISYSNLGVKVIFNKD